MGASTLLPPIAVSAGVFQQVEWSSDGRFLLIVKTTWDWDAKSLQKSIESGVKGRPGHASQIELWDAGTRKTSVVWRAANPEAVPAIFWLHGSSTAIVLPQQRIAGERQEQPPPPEPAMLYDASAKTLKPFQIPNEGATLARVCLAPDRPLAVLEWHDKTAEGQLSRSTFMVVDSSGRTKPLNVPPGYSALYEQPPGGSGMYFVRQVKGADGRRIGQEVLHTDLQSGSFREATLPAQSALNWKKPGFETAEVSLGVPDAHSQRDTCRISLFWNEGSGESGPNVPPEAATKEAVSQKTRSTGSILVGVGSVDSSQVAPGFGHVLYVSNGVLLVRPVLTISKERFAAMKATEPKSETMGKAKQVSLACLMYAADNDDRLPDRGTWQSDLEPYAKDATMLYEFEFTYDGPREITKVDKPAETVLGYIQGDGGRAVAYIDGHVVWVPDPPKP